jgi:hypothetical protein
LATVQAPAVELLATQPLASRPGTEVSATKSLPCLLQASIWLMTVVTAACIASTFMPSEASTSSALLAVASRAWAVRDELQKARAASRE